MNNENWFDRSEMQTINCINQNPVQPFNPYAQMINNYNAVIQDNYRLNNELYSAHQFISWITCRRNEPTSRSIKKDIYTDEWYCRERNGRQVIIGKIDMLSKLIVNPHEDMTFDAIYCYFQTEGKQYPVVIPYKDFIKRDILQHFSFFRRNIDCPDKYLVHLFYAMIQKDKNDKFLVLPEKSGWNDSNFADRNIIIPYLDKYYPEDIRNRQLLKTDKPLKVISEKYRTFLENKWKAILVAALRIASQLLFFYSDNGVMLKHFFVIEPASEQCAEAIIALTKTINYSSLVTTSLSETKTQILKVLDSVNDGTVLFRDESLVEDNKTLNTKIECLVNDVKKVSVAEDASRHLIIAISNNPSGISRNAPAYYLTFNCDDDIGNAAKLQRISGEFDYAFIQSIINDTDNFKKKIHDSIRNARLWRRKERSSTMIIILSALELMEDLGLANYNEIKQIINWFENNPDADSCSETSVVNDFTHVFNELINDGKIKFVNQNKAPYFQIGNHMAFISKGYINFEENIFSDLVLNKMKITHRRNKILSALTECELLYGTNNYKRNLSVMISAEEQIMVSVYSISISILNQTNRIKADNLANDEFLFESNEITDVSFLPLLHSFDDRISGKSIEYGNVENNHIFVTGMSGTGKTYAISQIIPCFAMLNHTVVIFDSSGSFTRQELERNLVPEVIEELFTFINIEADQDKIPVNLFSVDGCTTISKMKERLFEIITAATSTLDPKQSKLLKKCLSKMLKEVSQQETIPYKHIVDALDTNKYEETGILEMIESVFTDIEEIGMLQSGWRELISDSKDIIVISFGKDSGSNIHQLLDMMLASLYSYQVNHNDKALTIVVDEIKDQNLSKGSPLNTIITQGRKYHTSLIGATQHYVSQGNASIDIMKEANIRIFFRPSKSHDKIAAELGFKNAIDAEFSKMKQGECIINCDFYSKQFEINCPAVIRGRIINFSQTSFYRTRFGKSEDTTVNPTLCDNNAVVDIPEENTGLLSEKTCSEETDNNPTDKYPAEDLISKFNWY